MVAGAFPSGLSPRAELTDVCESGPSKEKIFCGALSSVMVKSSLVSPVVTGRFFLSSTVTSRKTSEEVTLIPGTLGDGSVAGDCGGAASDCAVAGGCCDWAATARAVTSKAKTTPRPARRSFIVALLKHSAAGYRFRRHRTRCRFYG